MRDRVQWLAVLLGAALFLAVTRGAVLDPRNTGWLLLHTDSATGYLGWEYFRRAPLAQLPFGANPEYGGAMASSVVFSDSIPLLAFLFKPFAGLLPARFQYFGLWLAACFALQALFSYKLLRRFSPNAWLALAGSAFFALAPVLLYRMLGHFALCGQWMLLAALCLYFAPRFASGRWTALLVTAVLVHFYLLVMVGGFWAADLWQRLWRREATWPRAAAALLAAAGATLAAMWLAGYFMVDAALANRGFGHYRMNLLALVDPNDAWSRLIPDVPGSAGEFEGFNYLGIGMLGLAVLVAARYLARRQPLATDRRALVPLVSLCVALTVLALSNVVALGTREVLAYEVPASVRPLTDLMRSSGRLFWPVYYLLYLGILVLVFRLFALRAALVLCVALLAAQVFDSAAGLASFRGQFGTLASSPLRAPMWAELGKRYRRLVYVLPRNAADSFGPWVALAASHGMAVNFGYFARVDSTRLAAARDELVGALLGYRLDPDSLYVFESRALWRIAAAQEQPDDVVGLLDGVRIIAPRLKQCAACDLRGLRDMWRERLDVYELGRRIRLGRDAAASSGPGGWSLTTEWGRWSQPSDAWLAFNLAEAPAGELLLTLEGRAFLSEGRRRQEVQVRVNGAEVQRLAYAFPEPQPQKRVTIPRALLARHGGRVLVHLHLRDTGSPGEPGWSNDQRPPVLGLTAITLSATP